MSGSIIMTLLGCGSALEKYESPLEPGSRSTTNSGSGTIPPATQTGGATGSTGSATGSTSSTGGTTGTDPLLLAGTDSLVILTNKDGLKSICAGNVATDTSLAVGCTAFNAGIDTVAASAIVGLSASTPNGFGNFEVTALKSSSIDTSQAGVVINSGYVALFAGDQTSQPVVPSSELVFGSELACDISSFDAVGIPYTMFGAVIVEKDIANPDGSRDVLSASFCHTSHDLNHESSLATQIFAVGYPEEQIVTNMTILVPDSHIFNLIGDGSDGIVSATVNSELFLDKVISMPDGAKLFTIGATTLYQ